MATYFPSVLDIPNTLLAALPVKDYVRVLPNLKSITLQQRKVLYEPDQPIGVAYFPSADVKTGARGKIGLKLSGRYSLSTAGWRTKPGMGGTV